MPLSAAPEAPSGPAGLHQCLDRLQLVRAELGAGLAGEPAEQRQGLLFDVMHAGHRALRSGQGSRPCDMIVRGPV